MDTTTVRAAMNCPSENAEEVVELGELQLAAVGGGSGDVVFH